LLRQTPILNPTKGPKSNPAKLPTDGNQSIYALFAQIFRAAINTVSSKEPVRFLSRYDKSAANIAESRIWATIGQTPWAHPYSPWYHRFVDFPFQALRAASRLGEYAIMDRGTWCAVEPEVRDAMAVFVSPLLQLSHFTPGLAGMLMKVITTTIGSWHRHRRRRSAIESCTCSRGRLRNKQGNGNSFRGLAY
jgi:hypothetical protein